MSVDGLGRWFVALLLGVVLPAAAEGRPNVILIMADDFGYECVGANGGTSYKTPALDGLAATGARFAHCYVQPLCTPTRVQLMTGMYNVRNYIRFGLLDPQAITFGNLFQTAGYATCIVGKWQLGQEAGLPQKFGFAEHCLWQHTRRPERYKNPGLEINGLEVDYKRGEYGPDLVNDYAIDWIRRKKKESFFLYYPMMLTHDPYTATPDSADYHEPAEKVGKKNGDPDKRYRHFADMVQYMDKLIGKLIKALDDNGVRQNTLVLFVGDNGTGRGTPTRMGAATIIGGKGTTTATGMHVPLIGNWPGTIPAGRVCENLVDSTDFLPTICAAADVKLPTDRTIDGRSFLPQLKGEIGQSRDWIYSWYSPRQGEDRKLTEFAFNRHYKLYRTGEFFDLSTDPAEKHPQNASGLTGPAQSQAQMLHGALNQFNDARPVSLRDAEPAVAKKKKAKAAG